MRIKKKQFWALTFFFLSFLLGDLIAQEVRRALPTNAGGASGETIRIAPSKGDPAVEKLAQANGIYARKMYDWAITEYNNFLNQFPQASGREEALWRLADAYSQENKPAEMLATYERMVRECSEGDLFGAACCRVAEIRFNEGRFAEALELFRKAIAHCKDAPVILASHYYEGRCLAKLGRHEEALVPLREVVASKKANPRYELARMALAESLTHTNKKEEALKLYAEIVASDSDTKTDALVNAIRLAGELGKTTEIRRYCTTALRLPNLGDSRASILLIKLRLDKEANLWDDILSTPSKDIALLQGEAHAEALAIIGKAYYAQKNMPKAWDCLDRLRREHPSSPFTAQTASTRANAAVAVGSPDALKELELATTQNQSGPERDFAYFRMGEIEYQKKDFTRAADLYGKISNSENFPADTRRQIRVRLAWCLEQINASDRAIEVYSKLIEESTKATAAPLLLQRGLSWMRLGRNAEALADFRKISTDFPTSSENEHALLRQGLICEKQNDSEGLTTALSAFLARYPRSTAAAQAEFLLGQCAFNKKKYDEALPRFIRARSLDSTAYSERATPRIIHCYYYLGNRLALASEVVNQKIETVNPEIRRWLIVRSFQEGDYPVAIRHLKPLLDAGDRSPDYLVFYAESLLATSTWQEALTAAGVATKNIGKEFPSFAARAWLVAAEAHKVLKNYIEADKAVAESLYFQREGRINAVARILAAEILIAQKKYDEAAKGLMVVALLDDDPAIAPYALKRAAETYTHIEQPEEAEKTLAELKKRYPDLVIENIVRPKSIAIVTAEADKALASQEPLPESPLAPMPQIKATPTPTPTPKPSPTPRPRPKTSPTPKASPAPSASPTPASKSKNTPTPKVKATPTPTPKAKATPTPKPKPTPTPKAKATPTPKTKATPTTSRTGGSLRPPAKPTPPPTKKPTR